MKKSPHVSIIIPTYRAWPLLGSCLEALKMQTISQDLLEIIVINNDPTSCMPSDLNLEKNVKILTQVEPGSYASRNLGIKESKGKVIAFTDSDCIPKPNWIEEGLKLLEQNFDLVGGKMEFFKPKEGDHKAFLFESRFSFRQEKNVLQNKQSITANLFVKREVFDQVGLFNQKLMSGGDFEWTKRATNAGKSIAYGEKAIVKHPSRKDFRSLINKKRRTAGGMYFSFFKDYSSIKKLKFILWILRPPVTIFGFKGLSWIEKISLFQARWYLEWIGVKEMAGIHFRKKNVLRE